MSIKELLKPRYKVVADYPGCPYEIGTVLFIEQDGELYSPTCGYSQSAVKIMLRDTDRFKHLIKKLEWWEERKLEELPQYIKSTDGKYVRELLGLRDNDFKVKVPESPKGYRICYNDRWVPATAEEYNNYKAKKDGKETE